MNTRKLKYESRDKQIATNNKDIQEELLMTNK
jgi:hypothetical protein